MQVAYRDDVGETRLDAAPAGATTFRWRETLAELTPLFAARAAAHDADAAFVSDNLRALRDAGFFAAAVPAELGGAGADQRTMGAILREIARHCGSTALAFSMHSHLVAALAWRWRRTRAGEALLRRILTEDLALVSSGGSDWIEGSGRAEPVEGGYRVTARKVFASGAPAGDVILTTAILDEDEGSATVLHFPLPLDTEGVSRVDCWDTLGMRGTGSFDLVIDDVFVPAEAVSLRRPTGCWHEAIHLAAKTAMPLIYAVYLGIAEAARDTTIELAGRRPSSPATIRAAGEMETELAACRLAVADMLAAADDADPGPATTNRIMIGRTLAGNAAIRTVEKAMEAAGGAGFYRRSGLERLFRDVQAARYHPLQPGAQADFAGRIALGLPLDGEDLHG